MGDESWLIRPEGCDVPMVVQNGRSDVVDLNELCDVLANSDIVKYFAPYAGRSALTVAGIQRQLESAIGRSIEYPTLIEFDYGDSATLYEFEDGVVEFPLAVMSVPEEMCEAECGVRGAGVGASACREMAAPLDEAKIIDDIIEQLRLSNESQLRELGLTGDALRFLLGQQKSYSSMLIDRHARILLKDYGCEIKMDDKTKALYFLYLRHPEGIAIKDLPSHIEELMDLYQSVSGRGDKDAMRLTVENLADPFQNNANISLSRIKKAFVEAFDDDLAKAYYVTGERGGVRRIALNRSLVTWETIR